MAKQFDVDQLTALLREEFESAAFAFRNNPDGLKALRFVARNIMDTIEEKEDTAQ